MVLTDLARHVTDPVGSDLLVLNPLIFPIFGFFFVFYGFFNLFLDFLDSFWIFMDFLDVF